MPLTEIGWGRVRGVCEKCEHWVARAGDKYRYLPEVGDPLDLLPIWRQLQATGVVDAEGFVEDRTLFAATQAHRYPDAVHRVWRAFHGMFVHTPDVFIAVEDGWHCGRKVISKCMDLAAAHGNLNRKSSCAFAMTTAGALPPVLRMEDLPNALRELGIRASGHKADSSAE